MPATIAMGKSVPGPSRKMMKIAHDLGHVANAGIHDILRARERRDRQRDEHGSDDRPALSDDALEDVADAAQLRSSPEDIHVSTGIHNPKRWRLR
jgi:hypothetical protein